jgi:ABC-2 type transport system permease protein
MLSIAPESNSPLWGIAYAAMGYPVPLALLMAIAVLGLGAVIAVFAPRFPQYVLEAGGIAQGHGARGEPGLGTRALSPSQMLRRKEWALLRRDPWLVSQTLVQILYLLWRSFASGLDAVKLLVPVLITASGQFSGGLAWPAISGEDAPDLIGTAPVPSSLVLRAKFEATIGGTLMVFSPFLVILLGLSPRAGVAAAGGILLAAASAAAIQYWYRLQAQRSRIGRRQTASRFTTYAEALESMSWAAAAALAMAGGWLAAIPAASAVLVVAIARLMAPVRR